MVSEFPVWCNNERDLNHFSMNCASVHRKMGTHISKVYVFDIITVSAVPLKYLTSRKSINMDTWTKEQVEVNIYSPAWMSGRR
jgi:hypothetical protein